MPSSGKKSGKNKKFLNTQRIVISNTQKYGTQDKAGSSPAPADPADLKEETFLEDTPAKGVISDKNIKGEYRSKNTGSPKTEVFGGKNTGSPKTEVFRGNNTGSPKSRETFRGDNTGSPKSRETFRGDNTGSPKSRETFRGNNIGSSRSHEAFKIGNTEKRYKAKKKGIFSVFSAIPGIFRKKSKTSNSSALEFASSGKRLSKKGRKNRRILIYAGTGLVVVLITLAVVFVPAQATPVNTQSPGASQPGTSGQYVAVVTASDGSIVSGDPSVLPSASPTPTQTPIVTTPPAVFEPVIDVEDEVQTFRVEADKYYNEVGYSNNHYKYTQEEKSLLSQVMWEEARGEGSKGMIAVGNVVMNRLLSGKFPGNSIKDLVTNGQFAMPNGKTNIWSNRAANLVLDYEQWVIPQNIFFFKVQRGDPKADWSPTVKYAFTIGGHAFFTAKKYGRTGMIPPQLFERTFEWPTMGCMPEMRVYKLQYMLNKLGYSKVTPDKYFGQDTKDAIIDFQKKHGLKADGIAGAKTLSEIIKEFGEDDYYEQFVKDKD